MRRIFATDAGHRPFAIGIPAVIWHILFFYLPLLLVFFSSFLQMTDVGISGITWSKIGYFFNPIYLRVLGFSGLLAFTTVVVCFLIAYPLAYFIAFRSPPVRNSFLFFLLIPFWTNFLLHVYAWFYVLEKHGFINVLLEKVGWGPLVLLNAPPAILIMMVYYYLPFMVLPIYSSLEGFDTRLMEASFDLGASWFQTFRRVVLPLTMKGVKAGFFLVYIQSFGEFAIPSLMGGDKITFVGNIVSDFLLAEGTGSLGGAFMVISCLFLLVSSLLLYTLLSCFAKPFRNRIGMLARNHG